MKKNSVSLAIRATQVNAILRFQLNQLRISIIKKATDAGEDEVEDCSKILGENIY